MEKLIYKNKQRELDLAIPRVIAFTGKMGTGKTTSKELLNYKLNKQLPDIDIQFIKFADPLYTATNYLYREFLNMSIEKDGLLMQKLGKYFRDLDPDCFIKSFKSRAKAILRENPNLILINDDVRFNNEAKIIQDLGGYIVKLEGPSRDDSNRDKNDVSENGIMDIFIDHKLKNTGNLNDLNMNLDMLFLQWRHSNE